MVGAKEVCSENEVCLAPTSLLARVTDEGPCEEMFLLKDARIINSNGSQVLLELRGVRGNLLQVLNILITRSSGVIPFRDDVSAAHVLLVDGGESFILLTLFGAFKKKSSTS